MTIARVTSLMLLLTMCAAGQDFGQLETLGLGRSRLRCTMVERRGVPVDADGRIAAGRVEFRELWLQKELPKQFPALETVDVVDRVLARSGSAGAAATAERILEIVGPTDAVERARAVVRRILAEPDRTLRFRLWAAVVRYPKTQKRPAKVRVDALSMEVLERRLEELASDESAMLFEKGDLELVNGKSASINVGTRIAYVKDYKLSQAGERLFLEPVVDQLKDGLNWSLGAVYDSESRKLALESDFSFTQVQKPIARFKGKVSFDDRELIIEKPVLAETRWRTDGLVLEPAHGGFVVSGIRVHNINGLANANQKAEMVLVVRYEVERISGDRLWGKVQGFDRAARLAFVRIKQRSDFEDGMKLEFERDGVRVAAGRVVERVGRIITVEIDDGEVRAGDLIQ